MNASRMLTNDSIALAMSLYFRLSRSRFGALLVLWADRKLMMFKLGIPITLESPDSRYSFWYGSSLVLLSPGYLSNMISVMPDRTTLRVVTSVDDRLTAISICSLHQVQKPCQALPRRAPPYQAKPRPA